MEIITLTLHRHLPPVTHETTMQTFDRGALRITYIGFMKGENNTKKKHLMSLVPNVNKAVHQLDCRAGTINVLLYYVIR